MNIAVIGAGGGVGRDVVQHIIADRLLQCDEKLIMIGSTEGSSSRSLFGFAVDLMDGYAEICPQLEVGLGPESVQGDLIVMAGGVTIPIDQNANVSRDFLAQVNAPIFESYARAIAEKGSGYEIVICVSNPNELAVGIFAKYLGRRRVIGMGAFLDSLRFKKEIAEDLGVRRQMIHAFIGGEHGFHMVPLWSGLHVFGYDDETLTDAVSRIRRGHRSERFLEDTANAASMLKKMISEGEVRDAFEMVNQYPPDIRVAIKPFITHFSGAKTVIGTGHATLDFLKVISLGSDALISGQIALDGEFYGISGVCGVPFVIGNRGVERVIELSLDGQEITLMKKSAAFISEKITPYL